MHVLTNTPSDSFITLSSNTSWSCQCSKEYRPVGTRNLEMARLTWRPGHDDNDVEGLPAMGQVDDKWKHPAITCGEAQDEVADAQDLDGVQQPGQLSGPEERGEICIAKYRNNLWKKSQSRLY